MQDATKQNAISQDPREVVAHYENLDMSGFPVVEPNILKQLKKNKQLAQSIKSPLDADVMDWLVHQDETTRNQVNLFVRELMVKG